MKEEREFDNLFRNYYEPLFRFANQYVTDEEDCHDIVSAVFEMVWLHFSSIEPSTVKSFLYTNVRNRSIDYLRHQGQKQLYVDFATRHSQQFIEKVDYEERDERQHAIKEALNSFDETTRIILIACFVKGLKYKDVAAQTGLSLSAVKKRIVTAMRKIREKRIKM